MRAAPAVTMTARFSRRRLARWLGGRALAILRRLYRAIMDWRQAQAARDMERLLVRNGGLLTDAVEQQAMRCRNGTREE